MLFVYDLPVGASFHMRNTLLQLDAWWFDADGVLIGSTQMEPCRTEACTSYRSPGPVRWVLETVQGEFDFGSGGVLSTSGND